MSHHPLAFLRRHASSVGVANPHTTGSGGQRRGLQASPKPAQHASWQLRPPATARRAGSSHHFTEYCCVLSSTDDRASIGIRTPRVQSVVDAELHVGKQSLPRRSSDVLSVSDTIPPHRVVPVPAESGATEALPDHARSLLLHSMVLYTSRPRVALAYPHCPQDAALPPSIQSPNTKAAAQTGNMLQSTKPTTVLAVLESTCQKQGSQLTGYPFEPKQLGSPAYSPYSDRKPNLTHLANDTTWFRDQRRVHRARAITTSITVRRHRLVAGDRITQPDTNQDSTGKLHRRYAQIVIKAGLEN
ncbi:hypothetical protein Cob_v012131 [Colletotrichum orbiculare MAFF 240422]|uniref:Uncharacterized protein n=1 Tax=Colletotrichum orbiculare (strain 104-T / ATCC 96160 / CBS 514.97 / LARS 414 / MAFF 240422) TaxID=1213857 RepID=A0A484FDK8_COLOR|nr:hypothetical protein Cob_v012131 [Colletotrichum orbiculare MAFF 240422]